MIWTVVFGVIGFIVIKFLMDLNKDQDDLKTKSLTEKFNVVVNILNDFAFNGSGKVTMLDKRSLNLYENGSNQIIHLRYGTGHLTIIWKYKYFQKEVAHEKTFRDVRNISLFEQQKIAEIMISEMEGVISNHQNKVR